MALWPRRLPFFRQHDATDCGPAVLRMVAGYYGLSPAMPYLRELAGADREGTSLEDLANAARQLGFEALPVWMGIETEEAPGLEEAPLPCVLHWEQRHFVVLYRLGRRHAWIADPAQGKRKISRTELSASWLGTADKAGALLLLPGEFDLPSGGGQSPPKLWSFVWAHLRHYRGPLSLLLGGVFLGSLVAMAAPFLAQAVVDLGMPNRDLPLIALLLTGQLLLALGQLSLQWWQNWLLMQLGARFQVNLLSSFLRRLVTLPQRFFDQRQTGDLLQRIEDHQRIEQWLSGDLMRIVYFALFGLVFGVVLLLYNPLLFGVFTVFSGVYIAWALGFLRARTTIDYQRFEQLAEHQETLLEVIQGIPDIKLQGSRQRHYAKWGGIQWRLFRTNLRALYIRQMQDGGAGVINQVKDLLLIFLASKGVVDGEMTLGMFVAVQFIIGQLNVPISQLVPFIRTFQDARISLERVQVVTREAAETEMEPLPQRIPFDPSGPVGLRGVHFRYQHSGPWILEQIDLTFPEGKKIAIVGASGSGKTTLIRLLLGLYQPNEGAIVLGENQLLGKDTLPSWRDWCGSALQDGFLFSDTIAQNIAEAAGQPEMERVREAARKADIDAFIQSLPHGYQTFIGPKGIQLSQGQRQRVLLARAWYGNPRFWVLDEATSALDTPSEEAVWQALERQAPPVTIVFTSHRLRTVQRADWVVVLENGRVVETGSPEALLDKGGVFCQLFA
ncbi:MAG: peptidase domain-containing ABC transporter [Lewinellaceae bacterium]|nr:peptidase domain-containing ABC transporter [Lewinellaceae bacterium]